jgi:hypothetical protein
MRAPVVATFRLKASRRIGGCAALLLAVGVAAPSRAQTVVDLDLVLAVDASGSVDATRFQLQRHGYAAPW